MRIGPPTPEEKLVNTRLLDLNFAWMQGEEYKVREALVNLNIAVRDWQPPRDTNQLEMNFGEKEQG